MATKSMPVKASASPAMGEAAERALLSAYGVARSTVTGTPLSAAELRKTHAYWRACNYLSLGMIYLQDNPLLREPLKPEHIKNRLLGHWGASPGLAFAYIHLNRLIKKYDLDMIFLAGRYLPQPGHRDLGVLFLLGRRHQRGLRRKPRSDRVPEQVPQLGARRATVLGEGRLIVELLLLPESEGLLALMLLHESRRRARTAADGSLVLLDEQDRSLWDRDLIAEGVRLVERAITYRRFGGFTLQAAIAAVHAEAASASATDWAEIVGLYDVLRRADPSAIVELNRAAAIAMRLRFPAMERPYAMPLFPLPAVFALVVNTVEEKRSAIRDSYAIRRAALTDQVPTYTTIAGARAAAIGLAGMRSLVPYSIQALHQRLGKTGSV